ncbi:MAG: phosphatase PAP2 family protein [Chitinophagaceae bacterium]|nr:phosphatase PAP2 family protein [Rubrivivax sp.]
MLIAVLIDVAKFSLIIACVYAALIALARRKWPAWADHLTQRRVAVLVLLTLAVVAVKLIEDVVAQESGPVDTAILWWVREHVPAGLTGTFAVVTQSGSAAFLVPLTLVTVLALLVARRRFEALLLALSLMTANLVVYGLKTIVGRARPDLWEAQWYWGSSFPSGHTLNTAALSTAAALSVARISPRLGMAAMGFAIGWSGLVAVSRLVLGVHWPSDVLAATCLGSAIALSISVGFDFFHAVARAGKKASA